MKQYILNRINALLRSLFFLRTANKFSCYFLEQIDLIYDVKYNSKVIRIACPNRINLYRAHTFFDKEPDMIQWLETIDNSCVLLDIGANIGLYSLFGAVRGAQKVIAIEPESQNYALLNKNIYINNLSDKIYALNIGFSDHDGLETLFIPKFMPGIALNNLGENLDWKKEEFAPDFKQGVLAMKLDTFVHLNPDFFPTHLKIDVDGIERKIIEGGRETLKDTRLKEVIIELNTDLDEDMEIVEILTSSGFVLAHKESAGTSDHAYDHLYNYLFIRK